jgi:hypothetical protein
MHAQWPSPSEGTEGRAKWTALHRRARATGAPCADRRATFQGSSSCGRDEASVGKCELLGTRFSPRHQTSFIIFPPPHRSPTSRHPHCARRAPRPRLWAPRTQQPLARLNFRASFPSVKTDPATGDGVSYTHTHHTTPLPAPPDRFKAMEFAGFERATLDRVLLVLASVVIVLLVLASVLLLVNLVQLRRNHAAIQRLRQVDQQTRAEIQQLKEDVPHRGSPAAHFLPSNTTPTQPLLPALSPW